MTLQVRPLRRGDGVAMGNLLLASSLRDHPDWRQGRLYGDAGTLVFDGDVPVAGIMTRSEDVWFDGRPVRNAEPVAAGIRLGAPSQAMPACRQAMADLWRTCDTPVIVKWGIVRDALNDLLGFAPAMLGWEVCFSFGTPGGPRPDAVRRAWPFEAEALRALYDDRAAQHGGAAVRSVEQWHRAFWPLFTTGDNRHLLVYVGPDGIDGYLALRPGGPHGGPGIMVTEWVDRTPEAFQGLWAMLHHLAGSELPVTLPPMPPDRPVMALVPPTAAMRPIRSLLVRPGQVAAFWGHVRTRPGDGSLRLAVRDAAGLWPERLDVSWRDGRITATPGEGAADVRTDVGTIALLALGVMSVGDARRLRLVDGAPEALAAIDGRFVPQPLYRYPADNRVIRQFHPW